MAVPQVYPFAVEAVLPVFPFSAAAEVPLIFGAQAAVLWFVFAPAHIIFLLAEVFLCRLFATRYVFVQVLAVAAAAVLRP